jgi:hypothetical protein
MSMTWPRDPDASYLVGQGGCGVDGLELSARLVAPLLSSLVFLPALLSLSRELPSLLSRSLAPTHPHRHRNRHTRRAVVLERGRGTSLNPPPP